LRSRSFDDTVLVRVRAASVNALDWHAVHGGSSQGRHHRGLSKEGTRRRNESLVSEWATVFSAAAMTIAVALATASSRLIA
jgi:hypothetical protein